VIKKKIKLVEIERPLKGEIESAKAAGTTSKRLWRFRTEYQ
jgi:hypothetical protein